MAILVLVHGGWGGSWCWRDAARMLRAAGHEVYAPTLTGLAERAHVGPEGVTLSTHVAEIAGLLAFEELSDAILIGHSYGGMVITGAADREPGRVAGMVYFDAFLPANGQSLWDLAPPETIAWQQADANHHDGGLSVPLPRSPRTPAGPGVRGYAPYTPLPIGTLQARWTSTRENPTWPCRHYILCTAYKHSPLYAIAARLRDDPDWTVSEIDAFHDVIYAQPERTAAAIEAALTSLDLDTR
ncbi:alpha/beta fold hydrolase [Lichenicoccus sp.]|uniref:alpha/beta fold hydrolase n=1 Tax=Lichenicoccus sp. TaxID=2781899 RepID=UPI003D0DB5F2